MSDPLNLSPVPAHIQQVQQSKLRRGIDAYRHNILLKGMYLADKDNPAEVPPPVGDDGKPLTDEKRRELAARRALYDPETFGKKEPVLGYDRDLQDHQVEEIGASGEKILQAQPDMKIVLPKELKLAPEGTDEEADQP